MRDRCIPIEYTSRSGEKYYLHVGETKTGKPKYYVARQLDAVTKPAGAWWQEIYGTFDNDAIYEEAMRLGREYRESLRPKPVKRRTDRATKQSAKRKK